MKRRRKNKTVVDVDMDEIRGIVDSSATGPLSEEQRNKLLSTLELLNDKTSAADSALYPLSLPHDFAGAMYWHEFLIALSVRLSC